MPFILKRLLIAIPTLFVVITVAFFMMRAAPGSPFSNDRRLEPAVAAEILALYGRESP
ncbi:MAG TPA: oligopeptide transporter permease, partial [Hyphomonadaceae bacterium]|nr:oligopeptide transporter permease [Hyphomonadaceae bacterium]